MATAVPLKSPFPALAIQAAPISAMEAVWVGVSLLPRIISQMELATAFPIMALGIPVLGGVGLIGVPFGELIGLEIK